MQANAPILVFGPMVLEEAISCRDEAEKAESAGLNKSSMMANAFRGEGTTT